MLKIDIVKSKVIHKLHELKLISLIDYAYIISVNDLRLLPTSNHMK